MMPLPRARPVAVEDWVVLTVDRFDHESVRALLDNRVAAIRRRALLDPSSCAASVATLRSSEAWGRYNAEGPAPGKLGVSQYEYGHRKEDYLSESETALEQRSRVVQTMPDPLQLMLEELSGAWPEPVRLAVEGERPYFAGVFRSGAGIRLHADWGPRDGPGWAIEDIVAQLAWNLYYSTPDSGGQLLVYDRPWSPELEEDARQFYYDYNPERVAGCRRVEIDFDPGDVVMFSSSNVHAVADASDGDARITASSFVGERPDGSLLMWS